MEQLWLTIWKKHIQDKELWRVFIAAAKVLFLTNRREKKEEDYMHKSTSQKYWSFTLV